MVMIYLYGGARWNLQAPEAFPDHMEWFLLKKDTRRHRNTPMHCIFMKKIPENTRFFSGFSRIYRDNLCARDLEIGATASKSVQNSFVVLYNWAKKKFRIMKLKIRKSGTIFHRETTIFISTMVTRNNVNSSQIDSRSWNFFFSSFIGWLPWDFKEFI